MLVGAFWTYSAISLNVIIMNRQSRKSRLNYGHIFSGFKIGRFVSLFCSWSTVCHYSRTLSIIINIDFFPFPPSPLCVSWCGKNEKVTCGGSVSDKSVFTFGSGYSRVHSLNSNPFST